MPCAYCGTSAPGLRFGTGFDPDLPTNLTAMCEWCRDLGSTAARQRFRSTLGMNQACKYCGRPFGDVLKHECLLPSPSVEQHTERAMHDIASGKIKTPEEFMEKIKNDSDKATAAFDRLSGMNSVTRGAQSVIAPGRVHALFVAGASIAELSRAFMVSEAEIEATLRGHIARRERGRK